MIPQTTTEFSPFELLFKQQPNRPESLLPPEAVMDMVNGLTEQEKLAKSVRKVTRKCDRVIRKTKRNIEETQKNKKRGPGNKCITKVQLE